VAVMKHAERTYVETSSENCCGGMELCEATSWENY
jgi:hypothetical protein